MNIQNDLDFLLKIIIRELYQYFDTLYVSIRLPNIKTSLIAKRGPRAPPGQMNGTNFFRLRIL